MTDASEAGFQKLVMDTAKLFGWMVVHYRKVPVKVGHRVVWMTPVTGDKGAPDLLLARDGVVLHPELKTDTGEVGPDQKMWAKHLGGTYRLWRPKMWDEILKELR